jgi:hypothetical protein
MPSLAVPQRRPFSLSGKSVGKLKILVAGGPGKIDIVDFAPNPLAKF